MLRSFVFLITVAIMQPIEASAAASSSGQCFSKDIRQVLLTIDAVGSFEFKYEVVRRAAGDYPTVLYVPGGPGGGSIGDDSIPRLIPDEFGLILTDPRGVGCNASQKFKAGDFSTANSASDLLSVLAKEKLNSANVILYGKSYGTELSTVTANLNFKQDQSPFRFLVLEGVLGRSMSPSQSSWDGYVLAAVDYFSQRPGLSEMIEAAITLNKVDRKAFAKFLAAYLLEGSTGKSIHPLDQPLQFMTDGMNFKVFDQMFLAPFKSNNSDLDDVNLQVWISIACSELGFSDLALTFEGGSLTVSKDPNLSKLTCADSSPSRPYDSKFMQLRERLIYLEGREDPAAPATSQARYHFNYQRQSPKKTLFLFEGFGHSILTWLDNEKSGISKRLWLSGFEPLAAKALLTNWQVDIDEKDGAN